MHMPSAHVETAGGSWFFPPPSGCGELNSGHQAFTPKPSHQPLNTFYVGIFFIYASLISAYGVLFLSSFSLLILYNSSHICIYMHVHIYTHMCMHTYLNL